MDKMTGDDVCVLMHTALRKACDSKPTTAAYLLIHMIENRTGHVNPWPLLGKMLAEQIAEDHDPELVLVQIIGDGRSNSPWEREWTRMEDLATGDHRLRSDEYRRWLDATISVFALFSAEDWRGMVEFLRPPRF